MKRNLNERIEEQKNKLQKKSSSQTHFEDVKFPDGTAIKADVGEFYDMVDGIASNYGLGGCKDLEEFIQNLDDTDIETIIGVVGAIGRRNDAIHGKLPDTDKKQPQQVIGNSLEPSQIAARRSKIKKQVDTNPVAKAAAPDVKIDIAAMKDPTARAHAVAMFLKSWGADPEKVNEAINKLKSGQIKIPDTDVSWITRENMLKKDFDIKLALETLKEAREGSINFDVSFETLQKRK